MTELAALSDESFCYITTTGRVSGRQHTIEIWFALEGGTIYMLAGNHGSDWVKNIRRTPEVAVRIGERTWRGAGRVVSDPEEDARARSLVVGKYQPGYAEDLTDWGRTSLAVAVDLEER
jgi:deazaflavin-dependent oxidoreductase (nitroreductase family)